VEDLDQHAAHLLSGFGEMFALPLRLTGVSGSPCRVVVRIRA
jgi:kynurenine formamidase